jgi:hypothetical protein
MPKGVPNASFHDRFLKRIVKTTCPRPELDECWLWTGSSIPNGYGVCTPNGNVKDISGREYTHRYSYKYYKGEIPNGMDIAHECDIRSCVNPNHLRADTRQGNVKDMRERNPHAFGQKFNKEQIAEIRTRSASTTINALAQEYNVERHTISRIVNNKTYT